MIIFFILVDTLFIQCALKCKKCAKQMMLLNVEHLQTQMISSHGREAQNDQLNRRNVFRLSCLLHILKYTPGKLLGEVSWSI